MKAVAKFKAAVTHSSNKETVKKKQENLFESGNVQQKTLGAAVVEDHEKQTVEIKQESLFESGNVQQKTFGTTIVEELKKNARAVIKSMKRIHDATPDNDLLLGLTSMSNQSAEKICNHALPNKESSAIFPILQNTIKARVYLELATMQEAADVPKIKIGCYEVAKKEIEEAKTAIMELLNKTPQISTSKNNDMKTIVLLLSKAVSDLSQHETADTATPIPISVMDIIADAATLIVTVTTTADKVVMSHTMETKASLVESTQYKWMQSKDVLTTEAAGLDLKYWAKDMINNKLVQNHATPEMQEDMMNQLKLEINKTVNIICKDKLGGDINHEKMHAILHSSSTAIIALEIMKLPNASKNPHLLQTCSSIVRQEIPLLIRTFPHVSEIESDSVSSNVMGSINMLIELQEQTLTPSQQFSHKDVELLTKTINVAVELSCNVNNISVTEPQYREKINLEKEKVGDGLYTKVIRHNHRTKKPNTVTPPNWDRVSIPDDPPIPTKSVEAYTIDTTSYVDEMSAPDYPAPTRPTARQNRRAGVYMEDRRGDTYLTPNQIDNKHSELDMNVYSGIGDNEGDYAGWAKEDIDEDPYATIDEDPYATIDEDPYATIDEVLPPKK